MLERMKQDDERLRSFEGEDYSAHRKSQVRQCLGFSTADFLSSLAFKSADEKPKHCLT